MTPPLRAALVTVGDELLLGRTVDTNAAWLGRTLAGLGIPVVHRTTVGDEEGDIRQAVAEAAQGAELVVVTGGLGPTPDDLTRDAVAELAGLALREDPDVLRSIQERFLLAGEGTLPEPTRRVAQVPEGATKLANPHGTAPGLALEVGQALVVLLPGVPREMRGIVGEGLVPLLRDRFPERLRPVHVRLIHTTGIAESALSHQIELRIPGGASPLQIAFLPDVRGVDLRFTALDMGADEALEKMDALEETLADLLAPWRFHASSGDLAESLVDALREAGKTLAVAESCTGGLIAKRVTDVAGASDVLAGGVVAYSNAVKETLLSVPAAVLEAHGAVSRPVAEAMAEGAARRLDTDAGIGVTGVAGPGGGTEEKPVGTVWYAAWLNGRVVARRERFPGDRETVRERAAQAAMFLLLRLLDGRVHPREGDASAGEG